MKLSRPKIIPYSADCSATKLMGTRGLSPRFHSGQRWPVPRCPAARPRDSWSPQLSTLVAQVQACSGEVDPGRRRRRPARRTTRQRAGARQVLGAGSCDKLAAPPCSGRQSCRTTRNRVGPTFVSLAQERRGDPAEATRRPSRSRAHRPRCTGRPGRCPRKPRPPADLAGWIPVSPVLQIW